jgi:hypothetical protein
MLLPLRGHRNPRLLAGTPTGGDLEIPLDGIRRSVSRQHQSTGFRLRATGSASDECAKYQQDLDGFHDVKPGNQSPSPVTR